MRKAYILLSGGIDSTTCLYAAYQDFDREVEGVSINYGQRHDKEIIHAKMSCDFLEVPHSILNVATVVPKTMLTDPDALVPDISYAEIEGVSPTYVPFRNGLMLSALTSHVVGKYEAAKRKVGISGEWGIYFGAHAEDAHNWAYPDCTPEFIGAMANAIYIGTYQGVRLHTPLEWLNKAQIIELGQKMRVRWDLTWSCYKGGDKHCGTCPTCRARREGFEKAGVLDPTQYASPAPEGGLLTESVGALT